MEKELLKAVPTEFLCPICGYWHDYCSKDMMDRNLWYPSLEYHNIVRQAGCRCCMFPRQKCFYYFYFGLGYMYYCIDIPECSGLDEPKDKNDMYRRVAISSFKEDDLRRRVECSIDITSTDEPENCICINCEHRYKCNACRLSYPGEVRHNRIGLGFAFVSSDYDYIVHTARINRRREQLGKIYLDNMGFS